MKKSIISALLFLTCCNHLSSQTIEIPFTGDYADPTIVRVGDDFYMTHTSHSYYPGLLIWHSKDLKKWTPVTRALHENVGTVWAPDIAYANDKFYIYFPTNLGGNYVVTADHIEGPWSAPAKLAVNGIDPGHIADTEGNRYLYVNGGGYVTLAKDGLSATSKEKYIYQGWEIPRDWAVECHCLESPKLFFHKGYYYMVSAQGGTSGPSTGHMAVVARSKNVEGPWENSPYNPLIHTYDPNDEWVSKGHATLFDDAQGNWYAVYHAYKREERPQGRSTLIQPVKWTKDSWPVLKTSSKEKYVAYANTRPQSDDFNTKELNWQWCFWGIDSSADYQLNNGSVTLKGSKDKLRALIAIASDADYEITAEIEREGNVQTGLALMYNDGVYAGIGLNNGIVQGLWHGKPSWSTFDAKDCKFLKLKVEKYTISVSYSNDGVNWLGYPHGFDVSGYHTNIYGGFHCLKPSILCKGEGSVTVKNVTFKY